MNTRPLLLLFLLFVVGIGKVPAFAADDDPAALLQQARAAAQKKNYPEAIALATRAIKAAPKQTQGWFVRAQLYDLQREYAKAVADYSEVLKRDPRHAAAWQQRGETHFQSGKIAESISDFDKFLSLSPDQKPYHWQRGISLYYAGRFKDGKEQFELHQTVNTQDVENAVWHFLCTVRLEGLEAAKKQLIPIEKDARVPMAQVHQLFAGKARPQEVLAAAEAAPAQISAGEPLFYAHLYLGLYFEAIGDDKQAKEYILKAAERSRENGYMGDVSRVHAEIVKKKKSPRETPPGKQGE
jgi:lipoprotein NlpI